MPRFGVGRVSCCIQFEHVLMMTKTRLTAKNRHTRVPGFARSPQASARNVLNARQVRALCPLPPARYPLPAAPWRAFMSPLSLGAGVGTHDEPPLRELQGRVALRECRASRGLLRARAAVQLCSRALPGRYCHWHDTCVRISPWHTCCLHERGCSSTRQYRRQDVGDAGLRGRHGGGEGGAPSSSGAGSWVPTQC